MSYKSSKKYSAEQSYIIIEAFFRLLYYDCSKLFEEKQNKSSLFQVSKISEEQFYKVMMLETEMMDPAWNGDWQESLLRTKTCNTAEEINQVNLEENHILINAFDLLEFKMGYYGYNFIPILFIIQRIMKNDSGFHEAIELWKNVLDKFSINPDDSVFEVACYNDKLRYDRLPPRKKLEFLSREKKEEIVTLLAEYQSTQAIS